MAKINTIHGEMDESLLEKREGTTDNANESTTWVEYWFEGVLVHRSVDMVLKPVVADATVETF